MPITISVDARQALGKMNAIPEAVRNNLRRVLPQIAKTLGSQVEANMDSRLQSHQHLKVSKLLIENPKSIYAKVSVDWTGQTTKQLVPTYLEYGTKPHVIEAVNAAVLAFYWPKIGGMFFGPRVNHPGNPAYRLLTDAFDAQAGRIRVQIETAVKQAAGQARPV